MAEYPSGWPVNPSTANSRVDIGCAVPQQTALVVPNLSPELSFAAPASMNSTVTFLKFDSFPLEIRWMIYKEHMTTTPQVLIYHPKHFPAWDAKSGDWSKKTGPPTIAVAAPALLHVCRESRQFALEHFHVRRLRKEGTRKRNPDAYHHIVSRPFDFEKDHILVHPLVLGPFVRTFLKNTPELARNLVFPVSAMRNTYYFQRQPRRRNAVTWQRFMRDVPRCINLKSVRLTDNSEDSYKDPTSMERLISGLEPTRGYRVVDRGAEGTSQLRHSFAMSETPDGISWKHKNGEILLKLGSVDIIPITG